MERGNARAIFTRPVKLKCLFYPDKQTGKAVEYRARKKSSISATSAFRNLVLVHNFQVDFGANDELRPPLFPHERDLCAALRSENHREFQDTGEQWKAFSRYTVGRKRKSRPCFPSFLLPFSHYVRKEGVEQKQLFFPTLSPSIEAFEARKA